MPRVKLFCSTGFAGCVHRDEEYIDDAEWSAMSEEQREEYLNGMAQDFLSNHIECGAYVDEGD